MIEPETGGRRPQAKTARQKAVSRTASLAVVTSALHAAGWQFDAGEVHSVDRMVTIFIRIVAADLRAS